MEESFEEQVQRTIREMVEAGELEIVLGDDGELLYGLSDLHTTFFNNPNDNEHRNETN
jgi:hypothetical protein